MSYTSGHNAVDPEGTKQVACVLNGEARSFPSGTTVADLFAQLNIELRGTAVEINAEVVPRGKHATHQIADGDQIEIVRMVGGG